MRKQNVVADAIPRNNWKRVLIEVIILAILAIFSIWSLGYGAQEYKVFAPVVAGGGSYPVCYFTNWGESNFNFWCNRSGSLGHGYVEMHENASGGFSFVGCMPWGGCATDIDDSNVSWAYDKETGNASIYSNTIPTETKGPGYLYLSVSPTGEIGGYGCWPWGECQPEP